MSWTLSFWLSWIQSLLASMQDLPLCVGLKEGITLPTFTPEVQEQILLPQDGSGFAYRTKGQHIDGPER